MRLSKFGSMTLMITIIMFMSLTATCGSGKKRIKSSSLDGVTVTIYNSNGYLKSGSNNFELEFKKGNKSFDAGKVIMYLEMQAMGDMPYMRVSVNISSLGNGLYSGSFKVNMGGSWSNVIIYKDGEKKTMEFMISVRK